MWKHCARDIGTGQRIRCLEQDTCCHVCLQRQVERPLSAGEVEAMRAHMEQDLREQLVQQGAELDAETLAKVRVPRLAAQLACQLW